MMANAARDPYWQATVRRETIDHPRHEQRDSGRMRGVSHADAPQDRPCVRAQR